MEVELFYTPVEGWSQTRTARLVLLFSSFQVTSAPSKSVPEFKLSSQLCDMCVPALQIRDELVEVAGELLHCLATLQKPGEQPC